MDCPAVMSVLGTLAAGAAAAAMYLAAPLQRRRLMLFGWPGSIVAAGLLATTSAAIFHHVLGPAESVYDLLLVVMIVLTALPFVMARRNPGDPQQ